MKTSDHILAAAMEKLAESIVSQDGVANAAIREAGQRITELSSSNERAISALKMLYDAADVYAADQSKVTDERIGLVQPVTADDGRALNEALVVAAKILENVQGQTTPTDPKPSLSEAIAYVRKYNDWRRGKIDWDDLMPEEVGRFLDALCDQAEMVERERDEEGTEADEWRKIAQRRADND